MCNLGEVLGAAPPCPQCLRARYTRELLCRPKSITEMINYTLLCKEQLYKEPAYRQPKHLQDLNYEREKNPRNFQFEKFL